MPRIKIKALPKMRKYVLGGDNDCPEGYKWNEFTQQCEPDPNYSPNEFQPTQQKMGSSMSMTTPTFSTPGSIWSDSNKDIMGNPLQYTPSNPFGTPPVILEDQRQAVATNMGVGVNDNVIGTGTQLMESKSDPLKVNVTSKKKKSGNRLSNVSRALGWGTVGLGAAGSIVNRLDIMRRQEEYDKYARESRLPDNYYAINTAQDRGDYDINDGMFRPNELGFKSKGQFANPYYAQRNFVQYGGMIKAAEGISIPGTEIVQQAILPDLSSLPMMISSSVPTSYSSSSGSLDKSTSTTDSDYSLPVEKFVITSKYGPRKAPKGPKGPASSNHNGIDLAVPVNTSIFAPTSGRVHKIYNDSNGGKQLIIKHDDGTTSGYAHLNNYKVNVGDRVERGQIIALSGNTGNSNGPHLHFTFRDANGEITDPDYIFNFSGKKKTKSSGEWDPNSQISFSHNNPLNIHHGKFTEAYGGKRGSKDGGGNVSIFPDINTGIQAAKDLLFGSAYNSLTISQARNKWVSGNPYSSNNSTKYIVQEMGGDKRLSDLSGAERDKLIKQFAKWEGKEGYNLIKNRRLYNLGGQNNNNNDMKIRIVGIPGENQMAYGGQPPYSGQSDYGLYIGQRNLYKTMAKHPYTDYKNTVSEEEPTENNPHVLEAEGGETIKRPDGTHMEIIGDKHYAGGEKLTKEQAPEGSFIYSDTQKLKIKDPEVLKMFGKSVGKGAVKGMTPAAIAKQYQTNKYLSILQDPNTDDMSKKTAKKMLGNYERKLAELALVQESMKGFPQGIPDIAKGIVMAAQGPMQGMEQPSDEQPQQAKYGGALRKFVGGGDSDDYDPEFLKAIDWMADYEQEGSIAGPRGYVGGGKNWGTNNPNIKTKEDAIKYYYENYWPMVKDLPKGLRTRALQLAVNTGDPYGEIMVAGSSFKGVGPFTIEDRKKAVREADALGLTDLDKNNYILQKRLQENKGDIDAAVNAYKANPREFLQNLDAEQNRYYNYGLQGINDDVRKFLTGYYQGVGNIADEYLPAQAARPSVPPMFNYSAYGNNTSNIPSSDLSLEPVISDQTVTSDPQDPVNVLWNPTGQAQQYPQVPGPYDPNNPMSNIPSWYTPWLKSKTKQGSISPTGEPTTFDPSNPNKFYSDYNYWKNLIGRDFTSPEDLQGSIYDYIESQDPGALDKMWKKWGPTAKGGKRKGFVDKYFGARTADVMGWRPTKETTTTTNTTTTTPEKGKLTITPGVIDEAPVGTTTSKTPGVPGGDPTSQDTSAGWTSQDIRNLGNAAMDYATLKKYHPYYTSIQPVLPEMVPVDWRGYAASLQSGANAAAQQLGTYQSGQSMAANLSQLAGQQAEGLGRYIGETDRANAAAATNVSAQRANMLNQFTQYNAALRDKAGEEENIYDDRYRAAERLARKGIVKAWDQGEDTASKIYNENITNPYYKINPFTQRIGFNDEGARAAFEAMIRNGGYQDGSSTLNQGADIYNATYERTKGTPEQKHDAAIAAMRVYGGGGRESNTEYPYNTSKNRTTRTTKNKYGGPTKPGYSYYNPFLR